MEPTDATAPIPSTHEREALQDPRALAVLTAEHASLLAARGLVYNESFARAGMFLTFLSATLVALGLITTATSFSDQFLVIAAGVLAVDLFIGLATLGRVIDASREDLRYLQGMNRMRHAYHDVLPGLERYFITGRHDDMRGIFAIYGPVVDAPFGMNRSAILHGFTTIPGMLSVICSSVAGTTAGVLLLLGTRSDLAAGVGCLIVLVAGVALSLAVMGRSIASTARGLDVAFPSPR